MRRLLIVLVLAAAGCTHASVSETPVQLADGTLAYRYQGRANFTHQFAEADRVMAEHCQRVNGGRPVILDAQNRRIGTGGFGQATFQPGMATGNFGTIANQNQELLYRCVN